jgi:hypothetical protein
MAQKEFRQNKDDREGKPEIIIIASGSDMQSHQDMLR